MGKIIFLTLLVLLLVSSLHADPSIAAPAQQGGSGLPTLDDQGGGSLEEEIMGIDTLQEINSPAADAALLAAFEESLQLDLLLPYYPAGEDSAAYGGFVENRSSTWALQQDSDKWVVPQSRYIWTAAKAAQFYAHDAGQSAVYLESAGVGFEFLSRMWGYDYNGHTGVAMVTDRDGGNGRIGNYGSYIVYGNSHALYAASAYYGASGDTDALDFAIDVYQFLNDYAWDTVYGGYYVSGSNTDKDTNVNIHVLEALLELYEALPATHALYTEVEGRIGELVTLLHDQAIHCETQTDCFAYPVMARDWTGTTSNVSPGHDAELAMLMLKALSDLGQDPLSSPYMTNIKKMIDFDFTHAGYRDDGAVYYTGNYNNGTVTIIDSQLQWWPQGEGIAAICLMHKLYPDESFYSDTLNLSWSFIEDQVIDETQRGWVRQAGGWNLAKASEWHANYHDSRAMMYCLDWLEADEARLLGDVNEDSAVDSTDALIVLTCEVGLESDFCPTVCGDVNQDDLTNSTDALAILSYDAGFSVPFPIGEAVCNQES